MMRRCSSDETKNSRRSRTIGPPSENTELFFSYRALRTNGTSAPRSSLVPYADALPCSSLVPLRVTTLMLAPAKPPWRTSNGESRT